MGLTATNQGAAAPSAHKLHSTGNGIDESQAEGKQAPNNSNQTQGNEWRNKNRPIFPEFFFLLMWGSCVRCCRAGTDRRGGAAAAGGAGGAGGDGGAGRGAEHHCCLLQHPSIHPGRVAPKPAASKLI